MITAGETAVLREEEFLLQDKLSSGCLGEGPGAGYQQGREEEQRANEGEGHSLQDLPSHLRVVDVTPVQRTRVA